MFTNRISSSTSCSIWPPETSPPSCARGLLRHHFQSCNTSVFLRIIGQDLVHHRGILRDLRLADEGRTVEPSDPHDYRATAPDALVLPRALVCLDQKLRAVGAHREPHRRRRALIAVLAHGRDINGRGLVEG